MLSEHPKVAMVAVGPVLDPVKVGLACAYIIPAVGVQLDADEIIGFAADRQAARPRVRGWFDSSRGFRYLIAILTDDRDQRFHTGLDMIQTGLVRADVAPPN